MDNRIIGLTGGIATGKTTVANYIAETYRIPVLDADIFAREAVEPGSEILDRIVQRYGQKILTPDGNLDRPQLGQIIFNSEDDRQWIEAQIHPYVRQRFVKSIEEYKRQTPNLRIVLVVPLLFEAGMRDLVTEVWVVSCSLDEQCHRLMERNNLSLPAAQARIAAQMPLDRKCELADRVLDNSGEGSLWRDRVDTELRK